MNELMTTTSHLMHFDGLMHWCVLIGLGIFLIGMAWVYLRVLLPLHRLAALAAHWKDQQVPDFSAPVGGIAELEALRQSLHMMAEQIRSAQQRELEFRQGLADSQEQERIRIARDIHDDTIQSLVLTMHELDRATQGVSAPAASFTDHLKTARLRLIDTIEGLRHIIADLRPPLLDELGLESALETLCEHQPSAEFRVVGESYPVDATQQLAIFRTVQEALRNAQRHAQATRIVVQLVYGPQSLTVRVQDNGVGFEVPSYLHELAVDGHYGLMGIRERVQHFGGKLHLTSARMSGTHLAVSFPSSSHSL